MASMTKAGAASLKEILVLAAALVIGLAIAFVDTRPTWDDTGITAFALPAAGVLIGLMVRRRPWLYALALGIWIPLWGALAKGNLGLFLVLPIPFAGVYLGWWLRRSSGAKPRNS
jgi:hypothetical protein